MKDYKMKEQKMAHENTTWASEHETTIPNFLPVEEKVKMGEDIGELTNQRIDVEAEKKLVTSQLGERIKDLQSQIDIMAKTLKRGYIMDVVKCQWLIDWKLKKKFLIRLDTKEKALDSRLKPIMSELSEEDKQLGLFDGENDNENNKKRGKK